MYMPILGQNSVESFDDDDTRHGMVATGGLVSIPGVDSRKDRDTRDGSDIVDESGRQPKSFSPEDYKVK